MIKNRKNTEKRWKCGQERRGHEILNPQIRSTELHPNNRQISRTTATRSGHMTARGIYEWDLQGGENTRLRPDSNLLLQSPLSMHHYVRLLTRSCGPTHLNSLNHAATHTTPTGLKRQVCRTALELKVGI